MHSATLQRAAQPCLAASPQGLGRHCCRLSFDADPPPFSRTSTTRGDYCARRSLPAASSCQESQGHCSAAKTCVVRRAGRLIRQLRPCACPLSVVAWELCPMHDDVSLSLRACGVGVDAVCAWLSARPFRGASGCDVMSAAVSARPLKRLLLNAAKSG